MPMTGGYAAAMIGSQVVGGLMGSRAAKKQAAAMRAQGEALRAAGRQAAAESRFKPIGVTTRFGTSTPEFKDGQLTNFGYTASDELSGLQDQLSRIYGSGLQQAQSASAYQPQFQQAAQGLFDRGLAEMPQSREQLMAEQQALLRPSDIEQEQRLAAGVFGRGVGGLSVGPGGNPYLKTLLDSRGRRDAQLQSNVNQEYMNRLGQSAGLFNTGANVLNTGYNMQTASLNPFMQQFGLQQSLEGEARRSMDLGRDIGSQITAGNQQAANYLFAGAGGQANMNSQAAQAVAAQQMGMGQGIANTGANLYQNKMTQNWLDQRYPVPQSGGSSPGGLMQGQTAVLPNQYPSARYDVSYS